MRPKPNRFSSRAAAMLLTLVMSFAGAQTAGAADITQNTAVVINSSNKATYHNKSIAGTVPADSYTGNGGTFVSQGAVVVDGIELNLTIDGFNVDYTVRATPVSGISLMNGATLHLTVKGENTLTAGFGGAGIAVPYGCTLEITSESDGTLHATGGKSYGGGAGIGSIGDRNNTNQGSNFLFPQGLGTIIINGGTIHAKGGTWYDQDKASGGAAGIGSSECSGATTSETSWGGTTYLNNITGSITINGGTVTATGGAGAAGIGGGSTGTLQTITITGGTVTATPGSRAAAIGIGFNGFTSGSGTLTIPALSITGGTVTANGPLGFGEAIDASQTLGASGTSIYRISYELNGGKTTTANPSTYETGVGVESFADPTRTGYDFGGWYDNDGFSGSPVTSIPASSTGNKTLYAKWTAITYNITYERNEGTISGNYRIRYTIETPTFDLPSNVTRDSCYFRGWYTDEDFASAKVTQIKQGTHQDFTFYAKWEKWDPNGDGSRWNPWKIKDEADLRKLAEDVKNGNKFEGKYFTQTADITITGGGWTPIGTSSNFFKGTYDGDGHTISGVNINTTMFGQGLFGNIGAGGFVQNITLINSSITGYGETGGIAGYLYQGVVRNCHVRSSVTVNGYSNSIAYIGGVMGYNEGGTITGCTSMATVSTGQTSKIGGIVGMVGNSTDTNGNITSTATVTNCFSYGMKPYGSISSSTTVTNVERVYKLQNTDGHVSLPDAVDATDGFYYDGIGYYKPGVSVPLTVTPAPVGYDIEVKQGSNTLTPDESGDYIYTTGSDDYTISATSHLSPLLGYTDAYTPDGSADKPYIINSTGGWNLMCDCLQDNTTWDRFSGKTVKLDEDITVTRMAGSSQHDFCGTFDGGGNTLTFNYDTDANDAAPFRYVEDGCVIENLRVCGTIQTSAKYAAGLIAHQYGNVTIRNCRSSVTIKSSVSSDNGDGTHGGFVAENCKDGDITFEGCLFDGKLLKTGGTGTNRCGGFLGWHSSNNAAVIKVKNSLYAPAALADGEESVSSSESFTLVREGAKGVTEITNSYYTETLGTAQGIAAYVYTPATEDFVPANVGAEGTAYDVSGITAYASGLKYDYEFYMEKADVSLADNAPNDVAGVDGYVADVTLQGRTLYKDGDWNTLCLPFDVSTASGPLSGDNVKAMVLRGSDSGLSGTTLTLNFDDAPETIPAGTPFIIRWGTPDDNLGTTLTNPVFEGVTVSNADNDVTSQDRTVTFRGSYEPVVLTGGDKSVLYLGAENKLYWPSKNRTMGACRAYFQLSEDASASAREFVLNFGDDDSTPTGFLGHTEITEITEMAGAWYDLSGRKLDTKPTKKGVYVRNGRKVIIK